ncbi:MAG TPA: hypothetical protein VF989_15830 [Polyangiaceae bacterium]
MIGDDLPERFHERPEAFFGEVRKRGVPIATLTEEGVSSSFDRIGLQVAVQSCGFAGCPEQREQSLSERGEHQQAVTARRVLDVRAGQPDGIFDQPFMPPDHPVMLRGREKKIDIETPLISDDPPENPPKKKPFFPKRSSSPEPNAMPGSGLDQSP